jgi:hypothetical protein
MAREGEVGRKRGPARRKKGARKRFATVVRGREVVVEVEDMWRVRVEGLFVCC